MPTATFVMPFDDYDYRRWAMKLGLKVVVDWPAEFVVEGDQKDIDQFSAELSFPPKA